ncbi:MAG: phage baseplate assembly protein V [Campylobacteraceae bacterium]|nr:phage baseplate assembly protein V [Campylobacteraceae bacterium]
MNNYIRLGVISEVQKGGNKARVKIGNNIVTDFLPVLQFANSYKRSWTPLRVKEQCVVLPILGEINAGVILRGIYYTEFPAPSTNENTEKTIYEDGTEITYTTETKTLNITGNVNITISGNANITVEGNTNIVSAATTHKGDITVEGKITTTGDITSAATVQGLGVIGTTVTVGGAGGSELKSDGGKFRIDKPLEVTGDIRATTGLVYDKFGAIRIYDPNNSGGA